MTVDYTAMLMFFVLPLGMEIIIAFLYQEMIDWHNLNDRDKAFYAFAFFPATFPVLILPSMGFVSLAANLFNSLYY